MSDAAPRHYEAVIKVAVSDAPEKRACDIEVGIGYAAMLLLDEYGWTPHRIADVLERTIDEVTDEWEQRQ